MSKIFKTSCCASRDRRSFSAPRPALCYLLEIRNACWGAHRRPMRLCRIKCSCPRAPSVDSQAKGSRKCKRHILSDVEARESLLPSPRPIRRHVAVLQATMLPRSPRYLLPYRLFSEVRYARLYHIIHGAHRGAGR